MVSEQYLVILERYETRTLKVGDQQLKPTCLPIRIRL